MTALDTVDARCKSRNDHYTGDSQGFPSLGPIFAGNPLGTTTHIRFSLQDDPTTYPLLATRKTISTMWKADYQDLLYSILTGQDLAPVRTRAERLVDLVVRDMASRSES
ncbi:hypothetical protein [Bombiscardovia coagulans]|nr:hypothetical protein [Bombiscardovia coagulans]